LGLLVGLVIVGLLWQLGVAPPDRFILFGVVAVSIALVEVLLTQTTRRGKKRFVTSMIIAGVFAGVVMVELTGWLRLDPLVALAVALHIVWTGVGLVRRSAAGLLDAAIPQEDRDAIQKLFDEYAKQGVTFHAFRTRRAAARRFVSFHLLVPDRWSVSRAHRLSEEIEARIRVAVPNAAVFTHIEPISDPASYEDQGLDR